MGKVKPKHTTKQQQSANSKRKGTKLVQRFQKISQAVKKTKKKVKTGLRYALAGTVVGGGVYVYDLLHDTPEEAHQKTVAMEKRIDKEIPKKVEEIAGTNKTAKVTGTVATKIAKTGVRHGGAVREWFVRQRHKESDK